MRAFFAIRVAVPLSLAALASVVACSSDGSSGASSSSSSSSSSGGSSSGDVADGGDPTGSSDGGGDGSAKSDGGSSSGNLPPPGGSLKAGKATRTIKAAGRDRSVLVIVPAKITTAALPLVIALHGNGDTSAGFASQTTQLEALAASKGFVLAAPQGITQTITAYGQTVPNVDWDPYRTTADGNIDLPLIDAIRAELLASGSIDAKKVFTFGYSQGGYMSFRYGMDTAASVSCAGVLAAASPLGPELTAAAARKVPVALQIGTSDYGIAGARTTKADLEAKSFPLDYHEIQGAGHVPVPGDLTVPLDYCLGQSLP